MLIETNQVKKSFVVLALNNETQDQDLLAFKGVGISILRAVKGVWQGVSENSYVVPFSDLETLRSVLSLAAQHSQDAVLVVNPERKAELYHLGANNSIESIGNFVCVPKGEALLEDSYTEFDGRYWIVKN